MAAILSRKPNETPAAIMARTPDDVDNDRVRCIAQGGVWDAGSQTCNMPKTPGTKTSFEPIKKAEAPKPVEATILTPQEKSKAQAVGSVIIKDAQGNEIIQTKDDIERQRALNETPGLSGAQAIERNKILAQQQAEGQAMSGQVGQFGQAGIDPTGLDVGGAFTSGIVDSIPRALSLAATGAGIGLATGLGTAPVTGGLSVPAGAAIGAAAGFVAGISSGMISSFKGQRRDTTTAQQRVLDEGKQTMKDWSTLAKADPANKGKYLSEYNKVSQQVDAAYRQMKLDTSRDVAKFETALPNLAEFEAFYASGGERDSLDTEMKIALQTPAPIEYDMLELSNRRKAK